MCRGVKNFGSELSEAWGFLLWKIFIFVQIFLYRTTFIIELSKIMWFIPCSNWFHKWHTSLSHMTVSPHHCLYITVNFGLILMVLMIHFLSSDNNLITCIYAYYKAYSYHSCSHMLVIFESVCTLLYETSFKIKCTSTSRDASCPFLLFL